MSTGAAIRRGRWMAALVSVVTGLVYLPALGHQFVAWDDNEYVYENPFIRSLDIGFLRGALFHFHSNNWHPLTWLSHALDYAIWELNPAGHHLTSVLLHMANTALVVHLVRALIAASPDAPSRGRSADVAATVTGVLFGLHPLHVESVAWISERKDLLCGLFFLLSLVAYLGDAGHPAERMRRRAFRHCLGWFALALLSKPMAVSLPIVLLLLDWYPLRRITNARSGARAAADKWPFFTLAAGSSVLTVLAQRAGGTVVPIDALPLSTRLLTAARSLVGYLGRMAWPRELVPYYPYPSHVSALSPPFLAALVLVIGISVLAASIARRHPIWLATWAYYVATVLPVLGLFQVGNQSMADRYTYLPSLGPFLLVGLGAAQAADRLVEMRPRFGPAVSGAVAAALTVALVAATTAQIRIWRDDFSLWNYVIEQEPERVFFAYNNRAGAWERLGEHERALADYDRAIRLEPTRFAWLYNNRGIAFATLRRDAEATADFTTAVRIDAGYAPAYYNLACLHSVRQEVDEACRWFRAAVARGYRDWEQIARDPSLDHLRRAPCFRETLDRR